MTTPATASADAAAEAAAGSGPRGATLAAGAPVIILGGGPIGLVCALLLARHGQASNLVDARPLAALQRDRRVLALSRGTLDVLEPLLGRGFAPLGEIHRIHVSSRGNLGSAQLGSGDFDGVAVGATVWYADLVDALARAAQAQPLITMQRPRRALELRQKPLLVEIALDNGATLTGPLAIDAEGTPPLNRDATQYALLAELEISCAPGDAIERFTSEGPLALLPLPATTTDAESGRMSMVWCMPAAAAQARRALPDPQLGAQLTRALGHRLGRPSGIGPRSIFPLHTHRLAQVCEHRVVHLGNAAQSLHPVAGQGFNLGIRDCACLVDCLAQSPLGLPAGAAGGSDPLQALHRYAARRRLDRTLFPALTSALPRIFSSTLAPVVMARSAGLLAMDLLPALRRPFTRMLMYGAAR